MGKQTLQVVKDEIELRGSRFIGKIYEWGKKKTNDPRVPAFEDLWEVQYRDTPTEHVQGMSLPVQEIKRMWITKGMMHIELYRPVKSKNGRMISSLWFKVNEEIKE